MKYLLVLSFCSLLLFACKPANAEPGWIQLFNGRDLTGWQVKIRGYAVGDNFRNTFRVENGILKVAYDRYDTFGEEFGHLFYEKPFSHYRLRAEYRFVGEQVPDGPDWAFRNNGFMLHSQPAA
ncbi:MAG: 3-keto-disaccharide hydrolase, partial [Robiginitalea sp.]